MEFTETTTDNNTATSLTTSTTYSSECVPVFRQDTIGYVILVVIEVLWNLLVLVAILLGRKRLQHNLVYSYVTSVVSANVALGFLMGYTLLVGMLTFERPVGDNNNENNSDPFVFQHENEAHLSLMRWWGFRRALIIGLFLVMSGSVASLIQGIADSAMFVGRFGRGKVKLNVKRMKRKVIIMISFTWIVPFIYTWLVFGWNCIDHCSCLPANYEEEQICLTDIDPQSCSYVWSPMTNGHLLLAAIIWLAQCAAIFTLLYRTIAKYRSTMKPRALSAPDTSSTNDLESCPESINRSSAAIQPDSYKRENHPLHPTIKLLIGLSVSYTLCTGPIITCILVDAFIAQRFVVSYLVIKLSSAFVFVYCFACPALLIAYMPGLRSAVVRMFHSCLFTTTTVVDKKVSITTVSRS